MEYIIVLNAAVSCQRRYLLGAPRRPNVAFQNIFYVPYPIIQQGVGRYSKDLSMAHSAYRISRYSLPLDIEICVSAAHTSATHSHNSDTIPFLFQCALYATVQYSILASTVDVTRAVICCADKTTLKMMAPMHRFCLLALTTASLISLAQASGPTCGGTISLHGGTEFMPAVLSMVIIWEHSNELAVSLSETLTSIVYVQCTGSHAALVVTAPQDPSVTNRQFASRVVVNIKIAVVGQMAHAMTVSPAMMKQSVHHVVVRSCY